AERAAGDVDYFGSDQEKRLARPVFLTGERPVEPRHTLPPAPPGATGPPAEPADLFRVAPEEAKEKTRVPVPHYSRREAFVRLAVGGNPYFRRALVNRIWAMLLGRGLVEPVDQMHGGNPATHPELLETLAADFGSNGYSLKRLLRTLVLSRTYGLSSRWPGGSPPAPELYAVSLVRPQSLPQLAASTLTALGYWDRSLRQATEKGGGKGSAGPALDAVRAAFETTFAQQQEELRRRLDTGTELFLPGVSQALYLTNGPAFQELVRQGGLVARLASLPDPEAIRAAYRAILSREPEVEERAAFERHLVSRRERRPAAVEQMVWALLTSSEFRFVH
ncbi:MAG: DUF1553 domain-containing protein, partial [Armatimonadetes bacterium]|nr:DUF1553 domain-containing protein [Armatimonadota bacterium]